MAQARHRTPSPQIPDNELIYDLWDGLKPFATRLRDLIMPTATPDLSPMLAPTIPQATDPTPQYAVPHLATRKAACTHLTMERLYGDFQCSLCHRFPDFGWVYSCVQDDEPHTFSATHAIEGIPSLTVEGTIGEPNQAKDLDSSNLLDEDPRPEGTDFRMPTAQLNPWIEKAIKEGHYTPEQVEILRAQKQKVFETAKTAIERFQESEMSKNTTSPARKASTSQSVDANPHLPFPVINEVQEASTEEGTSGLARPSTSQLDLRMFPHCKFRACQLCRPTYRDRTWQCFGHIFELEVPIDIASLQEENRPLGSVSMMRTIGLRKPPVRRRFPLRTHDSRSIYTSNEAGQLVFQNNSRRLSSPSIAGYDQRSVDTAGSEDISDAKVEEPESKGFRESMRRAFKSMMLTRRDSSRSELRKRKGRDSSESTSTEVDAAAFDMGLWQELNDELLREASSVPLPGKDSIKTDASNEEVGLIEEDGHVEADDLLEEVDVAGVAITEEAAETGTNDIIMSV
jgi:hypothetical protein